MTVSVGADPAPLALLNGSFEEPVGTNTVSPGVAVGNWTAINRTGYIYNPDDYSQGPAATDGNQVAQLNFNGAFGQLLGTTDGMVDITLSAKCALKDGSDAANNYQYTLGIYTAMGVGGGGAVLGEMPVATLSFAGVWEDATVTAENVPAGVQVYAVLSAFQNTGSDLVFFDDVQLSVQTAPPRLHNGSFEEPDASPLKDSLEVISGGNTSAKWTAISRTFYILDPDTYSLLPSATNGSQVAQVNLNGALGQHLGTTIGTVDMTLSAKCGLRGNFSTATNCEYSVGLYTAMDGSGTVLAETTATTTSTNGVWEDVIIATATDVAAGTPVYAIITATQTFGNGLLFVDDVQFTIVREPPSTVSLTSISGNVMEMVVYLSGAEAESFVPQATTDLITVPWTNVPHSATSGGSFAYTNLSVSTPVDGNKVIYLESTEDNKFFKLIEQ